MNYIYYSIELDAFFVSNLKFEVECMRITMYEDGVCMNMDLTYIGEL